MLRMKYLGQTTEYDISFNRVSDTIVQIVGDVPIETNGFQLSREGKDDWDKMDYSDYRTVYREIENGAQFSCDGSIYIPPTPKVVFNSNGGGTLDGATTQEAWKYEELSIPEPIANENYEFTGWVPEIPSNGDIVGNKTFTAIFVCTVPEPEPEPTPSLEERIQVVESDIEKINEALGGV